MNRVPSVFKLRYPEGFEWLLPANGSDFDRIRFDGQTRANLWNPLEMKKLQLSTSGEHLLPGDFLACSGGELLIFGERAHAAMGGELARYGELLPLWCEGKPFWILNVTTLVDALDEGASRFLRLSDSNTLTLIQRHVFKADALPESGVFKLTQTPRGLIYVTEAFARKVRSSGLRGLDLVPV